jgi:hypothetical protein
MGPRKRIYILSVGTRNIVRNFFSSSTRILYISEISVRLTDFRFLGNTNEACYAGSVTPTVDITYGESDAIAKRKI